MVVIPFSYALLVGNNPAPRPSAFSESNRIRAGEFYAKEGFLTYSGLPNVVYGDSFREYGATSLETLRDADVYIYTRYPNGPDWMMGIMTMVLGPGQIFYYRIPVLLLNLFGLLIIAYTIEAMYGLAKSAYFMLLLAIAPAFFLASHNFHTNGYSLAFMYLEWCLLLLYFSGHISGRRRFYVALAVLAFLQGCITYDYCFLVVFSPFALCAFFYSGKDILKKAFVPVLVLGVFFTFAHVLHFLQVAHYRGGIAAAATEYAQAATYRSMGDSAVEQRGIYWRHETSSSHDSRPALLWRYWYAIVPGYFNGPFLLFIPVFILATLLIRHRKIPLSHHWIVFEPRASSAWSLAAALFISSLWVIVMHQHSFLHIQYIPFHFTFIYFVMSFWLIHSLSLQEKPAGE